MRKELLFGGLREEREDILSKSIRTPDGLKKITVKVLKNFGGAMVVLNHDENLGTVYFPDEDFITPNMPKLKYAIEFKVRGARIEPTGINPAVMRHAGETGYFFVKRDGFNLLFYEHRGEVVPKTRLLPVAGKLTGTLIEREFDREFMGNVERAVKDGYIPIFEVWGKKLDDYGIIYGSTNPVKTTEFEGKKGDLFVELLAVRVNDGCDYPYVPAGEVKKLADEYGFETPPLVKKTKIDDADRLFKEVVGLMEWFDRINKENGDYVYEGAVLHVGEGTDYGMFKVKAYDIMVKDVILPSVETNPELLKKVDYEVSKILLDFSPDDILFDGWGLVKQQLREYLAEDIKDKDLLQRVYNVALSHLIERASEMIVERYLDDYCGKIREKFKEYRKLGVRIDKKRRAMINKIMVECKKAGKL